MIQTSDGEDFRFSYSLNDSSYIEMLTVATTADNDTFQSYVLPISTSGTVYIKVEDTDRTAGKKEKDKIYVDEMYIESTP